MAEIDLRHIEKSYGETAVVKKVSLTIRSGEFLTLVGPSGCGKSTLLRIIAGLEAQDSGEVVVAGRCVDDKRPKERDVAMVFQSYALYPHLSVFDNLALPLRTRRLSFAQRLPLIGRALPGRGGVEAAIRAEVEQAASMLDIAHLLQRKPGQLSGGQRQRVALGRAMVRHPAVFLMDEPLSNLDAKLRVQMRAEITALHRRLGVTFVYVTHDQAEGHRHRHAARREGPQLSASHVRRRRRCGCRPILRRPACGGTHVSASATGDGTGRPRRSAGPRIAADMAARPSRAVGYSFQ